MSVYLVTGGAGFIGSNLVHELLQRGETVRVLDNFSTGRRSNLADIYEQIDLVEGDLRSSESCRQATKGVDVVLHQGALPSVQRSVSDPFTSHDTNATATMNLLVAAREAGVKRFVYASSSSVYGDSPTMPKQEEMIPRPKSPYAVAKLAGEHYCRVFWELYGLETVCLRYFNVFGPYQDPTSHYSAVIPYPGDDGGQSADDLWRRLTIARFYLCPEQCPCQSTGGNATGGGWGNFQHCLWSTLFAARPDGCVK